MQSGSSTGRLTSTKEKAKPEENMLWSIGEAIRTSESHGIMI